MNHVHNSTIKPMSVRATALVLALTLAGIAGCANMGEQEKGTAVGAGVGAGVGAVLASATGNKAGKGALLGGAVGAVAGNLWSKRQEERRTELEKATQGSGVDVSRTPDNQLKLNIPNDVSFDVGSATLKPPLRGVLDSFASSVKGDTKVQVAIVGHTDSTGSTASNVALSNERARHVKDYLVGKGLPAAQVGTSGKGEEQPVADNGSDAGRARNRRVEIFLSEPGQQ
jgi:outer membrane protein OmpA-like peptidoglycan-associated protein